MAKQRHNYRTCRDENCHRLACQAYREGFEDGYTAAHDDAAAEED